MDGDAQKGYIYREEDKPMAIDPKEIKSIEDSMVHDPDEEPKPEGVPSGSSFRSVMRSITAAW